MVDWNHLHGKTVFVTGSTGLIGALIVSTLLELDRSFGLQCRVIAGIRSKEKAIRYIGPENDYLKYYISDIKAPISIEGTVDFIVHTASQTSSRGFVNEPVETIDTIVRGTRNVLNLAKDKKTEKLIYLSTMEVYGTPQTDEIIDENTGTNLYAGNVRSCYPLSKLVATNLCASYAQEYGVNSNVLVLTQTFGPGVQYNDGRVFAEFARSVIEGNNIVLHTKGQTKRSYLYTSDAVSAIFLLLLNGKEDFDIFNAANEETYCSILELANRFCNYAPNNIVVKIEIEDHIKYGYAPILQMNLGSGKLRSMGWRPKYNLDMMIKNLVSYMQSEKESANGNW